MNDNPPTYTPLVLLQSSWRKIKRPSRETVIRMCEGAYWTVVETDEDLCLSRGVDSSTVKTFNEK